MLDDLGHDYRRTQITGCYLIQALESQICGEVIVSSSNILSRQCFEITYCCLCSFSYFVEWPCQPLTTGTTASNAMWDDVVRLNAEFGIDTLGSPRPHTPPSSSALEVDPVSWNIPHGTWSFSWAWPGLAWFQPPQVKWVSAYNGGPICSETGSLECLTIIFDWLMYLLQCPTNLYTTKRWSISWGTVSAFERWKFQSLPVHGPHLVPGSMLQHFKPLDSVPNPLHPFDEGEEMLDELGGLLPWHWNKLTAGMEGLLRHVDLTLFGTSQKWFFGVTCHSYTLQVCTLQGEAFYIMIVWEIFILPLHRAIFSCAVRTHDNF